MMMIIKQQTSLAIYNLIMSLLYLAAGCLIIVFNYTGDRLNFGRALTQARQEKLKVTLGDSG